MDYSTIFSLVDDYKDDIINFRRDFHKYPEAGWTEFRTTSKIIDFLTSQGIPIKYGLDVVNTDYMWAYPSKEVIEFHKKRAIEQGANPETIKLFGDYTGVVAEIDSGKEGKVIALRFDMDCVEIDESKSESHRPFREGFSSVNKGCMHACGHDGHTTMGLIIAAVLNKIKDQFSGKVKIIYQLGEEGDKGAQSMVEKDLLYDADMLLSVHLGSGTEENTPGLVGSKVGLYATTKFDAEINGKASHAGALPEEGNNAIQAACMAIQAMYGFLQDGRGHTRLNVGTIEGGTGRNVIPETCRFKLETRGSNTLAEERLYKAAVGCIESACKAHGCTYTLTRMGYGPTAEGDLDLAQKAIDAARVVPEIKKFQLTENCTGSTDDFTYMMQYMQKKGRPATYMGLNAVTASGYHTNTFDFDESVLASGIKAFIAIVLSFLSQCE